MSGADSGDPAGAGHDDGAVDGADRDTISFVGRKRQRSGRKPGRPRGSRNKRAARQSGPQAPLQDRVAEGYTDPASLSGSAEEPAGGPSRRSFAGGATASRSGKGAKLDLTAYTGIFVALHMHMAVLSGAPELAISEDEGKAFLGAAQNVMRHYHIDASQKALDWCAFAFIAFTMYGPRAVALAKRRGDRTPDAKPVPTGAQAGPGNVFPFNLGTPAV